MASEASSARATAADFAAELDRLYPGRLALLLVPICTPFRPHTHPRKVDGAWRDVRCEDPGKVPLLAGWNTEAVDRWRNGAGREAHIEAMARHLAGGGNVGLVVPPGALVLDADTQQAVAGCAAVYPDAPMQESRPGRAHVVVAVPEDAEINATVKLELAAGITVDLRSAGRAQIVVEPSRHATGSAYHWLFELPADLTDLPALALDHLERVTAPRARTNGSGAIPKGQRNDELFRIAAAMRGRGESEHAIHAELLRVNAERCTPPLDRGEVERIAASAARYPGGSGHHEHGGHVDGSEEHHAEVDHLTDLGNAERLVHEHGADLRYVHRWGKWLAWDGRRLAIDSSGEAHRRAKAVVRAMYQKAALLGTESERKALAKWAQASESAARIDAMLGLAESEPGIPLDHEQLDQDPWLFNVMNGTIRLGPGELREHRRSDLISKLAPVAYDLAARAPTWVAFLERILPDAEVRGFVQRAAGYSLTGETREQVLFLCWGGGANGKTTFVETLMAAFGDYAIKTPAETLLAKRETSIPNDVARLRGARFVAAVESEEGRRLAEVRVKELTGGDTVSARFMRAEWFDFKPVCKLWVATNHKPQVRGTDEAIWRRIRLIPFTVTIPEVERDSTLPARLRAELPGILAWAVRGCLDWQKCGLRAPKAVLAATSEYRHEQDVLGAFLEERCTQKANVWIASAVLFRAYRDWCDAAGEKPMTQRALGLALRERGFADSREGPKRTRGWSGIGLCVEKEATATA